MSGEDECCKSFYSENSAPKTQRFINAGLGQVPQRRVVLCRGGAMSSFSQRIYITNIQVVYLVLFSVLEREIKREKLYDFGKLLSPSLIYDGVVFNIFIYVYIYFLYLIICHLTDLLPFT